MHILQRECSCGKYPWKILEEMVFIVAVITLSTLDAPYVMTSSELCLFLPSKDTCFSHCTPVVRWAKCFWWLFWTMAEFRTRTLFCRFCFRQSEWLHWHALSKKKNSTAVVRFPANLWYHMCLYLDVKQFPCPPILLRDISAVSKLFDTSMCIVCCPLDCYVFNSNYSLHSSWFIASSSSPE